MMSFAKCKPSTSEVARPLRLLRNALPIWLLGLLLACSPSTDLTVAPPPTTPRSNLRIAVPPPRTDGRLASTISPQRYHVALNIDPKADRFSGEVVIDVTLRAATSAIVLHGAELTIKRAEIISGERRIKAETMTRKATGATRVAEELVLLAASPIPVGKAKLHLEYSAPLTTTLRGIYRVVDEGKSFVFTQLEPADARRVFPCFDDPIYKVPFDVEVTVPKGNEVFGNAPEHKRVAAKDGSSTTITFATSKPLPTYLFALAIGPLEVRQGPTEPVNIRLIASPGKTKLGSLALRTAQEQLSLLAKYFGRPYPYAKLDLVAVPNFGPGAMENAGLITFREEVLLADEATASAATKREIALTIAHELAHQWFGNLVTMRWWDDLWLNEGFATYMETLIVDRWRPAMRADLELLSWIGRVMLMDGLSASRVVRQPVNNSYQAEDAFDGITYIKGASVIRMLHHWLGEENFQRGVVAYLNEAAWSNASAADLFRALSSASGKNVGEVASTFLDAPGFPLLQAELKCDRKEGSSVSLAQRPYPTKATPAKAQLWQIPVCVAYGLRGRRQSKQVCTLLSEGSMRLPLGTKQCPQWIMPNADYRGYYRYTLPTGQRRALARATHRQSARDKIGYLSNVWALVLAGEADASEALRWIHEAKREKDAVVIREMIQLLKRASDTLVEPQARPDFEALVAERLLPLAKRLGWKARKGESEDQKLLRHDVLDALAVLGNAPWLRREAIKRAERYLSDPKAADGGGASIALQVAARQGKVSLAQLRAALKTHSSASRRINLVRALGALAKPSELERAFELLKDGTVRAQDARYVIGTAAQWPDSRAVLIGWLEHNLDGLAKKLPGFGVRYMLTVIRKLCDPAARRAAEKAFQPLVKRIGGQRQLDQALEAAAVCIDVRQRQASGVTEYLRRRR